MELWNPQSSLPNLVNTTYTSAFLWFAATYMQGTQLLINIYIYHMLRDDELTVSHSTLSRGIDYMLSLSQSCFYVFLFIFQTQRLFKRSHKPLA